MNASVETPGKDVPVKEKGATMEMNKKAEKFSAMLQENKINCFQVIEVKDEAEAIVYRSTMEIAGQQLPVAVIIDKSVFVMVRTFVANKCLEDEAAKARLQPYIDELNGNFKVFKYYIKEGSLILDMCLPTTDAGFEPDLIRVLVDLAVKHLMETYPILMEKIWGKKA